MRQQIGQQNADETDQRPDREIDAAGDDYEGGANAENSVQRGAVDDILNVSDMQKLVARSSGINANDDQQAEDSPYLDALSRKHDAWSFRRGLILRVHLGTDPFRRTGQVASRQAHNGLFAKLGTTQFAGKLSLVHDEHAVREAEDFFQIARGK